MLAKRRVRSGGGGEWCSSVVLGGGRALSVELGEVASRSELTARLPVTSACARPSRSPDSTLPDFTLFG